MAAGKAVVASDVGGVPEIVLDGETGRLVPPDDPAALSQAIAMLAVNGELRERMGRSGRSRAKNFDWSGVANQYVDLYRHVLDDNAVTQESSA
jgi:glycosyltransferase involved in cell wall biosynthesis